MSILDFVKEHQSKKEFSHAEDKAVKLFDTQKQAVKSIKDTEGYREIKEFFKREKEAAENRMITSAKEDKKAFAVFQVAKRFLAFLESREVG